MGVGRRSEICKIYSGAHNKLSLEMSCYQWRPLNMPSQVIGEYVESLCQVKEVLYVKREELLTENSLIIHCQTISSLCFFHVGVELT